jgi:asparagine synthase (glutamine-hydrolysing)
MCGIVGFWQFPLSHPPDWMTTTITRMRDTLTHRGPDDSGIWVDTEVGTALGHRRLSILDLSPQGHQPMFSADGRFIIVFNGEIYNFLTIRQELKQLDHTFRSHSDTEVLLTAFIQWGVEETLTRCVGMFAFALWDRQERCLTLGRDRLGEKPLYYGRVGNTFLFASELKAIKAYPDFTPEIDRDALALFLRFNYIPAPYSIYRDIYKLLPATYLQITPDGNSIAQSYWSARQVAESGIAHPFQGNESEAVDHLENLLKRTIRQQMVADVPLGAFLSGGIDSSTLVALLQSQSDRAVKTFTIGFHDRAYNEANYAREVAKQLGCEHTELYIAPQAAIEVIPQLATLYDEPFADASQIPTFLVSSLAKQQVTVSLSGDGGDELFGGYRQYFWGQRIQRTIGKIPPRGKQGIAKLITSLSPDAWNRLFQFLPLKYFPAGDSLYRLAGVLSEQKVRGIYQHLISQWQNPESVVIGSRRVKTIFSETSENSLDFLQWMMFVDMVTSLPDDILVKVDRATMGVSLESRTPFLDHRIVEFAWQLPLSMKVKENKGKWILRELLSRYIPCNLIERPKQGFAIPLEDWLRTELLRDWVESLLSEKRLQSAGFFHPHIIRQKWQEHLSGRYNWQSHLWNVLMFQAWLEQQNCELT